MFDYMWGFIATSTKKRLKNFKEVKAVKMYSGKFVVLVILLLANVLCNGQIKYPDPLNPRLAIDPIWPSDGHSYSEEWDTNKLKNEDEYSVPKISKSSISEPKMEKSPYRQGMCWIGTNNGDLPMTQPILVSRINRNMLQPSKDSFVNVNTGDIIDMYCSGSFVDPLAGKKIAATCVEENIFMVNGKNYNFTEIRCSAMFANSVRKTSRTCYESSIIIEVGFNLVDNFIHLMDICHDLEKQVSHWVHYNMGPYLAGYQSGISRPSFITGGFYGGTDVNQLYTQVQQKKTVDKILGYDSEKFFNLARDIYMARGHMAAKVDFVYAPAQWATFYFLNAAPQWQSFNGGNWERVEYGVRKFASDRNIHLDVYTGNWGVMSLPNINGEDTPLYLNFDVNGNGLIPVPKIYWRVIIDKATNLGVAFIGVNNVHATVEQIEEEYILCNDISQKIDWIPWDKNNILKGYSYACEVNDLAEKISTLPDLEISGLLY